MTLKKTFTVLILALLLTGCGERLSYKYADWIIDWYVGGYTDWNKEQKNHYKQTIDNMLIWHKETQLLRYRDWLVNLKAITYQTPDAETLITALEPLEQFVIDIVDYIFDDTALLLASLSDEQVKEMIETVEEQQEDYEEDYRDEKQKKWEKRQLKAVKKASKRFLGRLTKDQTALIDNWLANEKNLNDLWLDNRLLWIEKFKQTLAIRQDSKRQDEFQQQLRLLFLYNKEMRIEGYEEAIDNNIQNSADLVVKLLASLNEKQRKKLDKQFDKYIKILEDLAK